MEPDPLSFLTPITKIQSHSAFWKIPLPLAGSLQNNSISSNRLLHFSKYNYQFVAILYCKNLRLSHVESGIKMLCWKAVQSINNCIFVICFQEEIQKFKDHFIHKHIIDTEMRQAVYP